MFRRNRVLAPRECLDIGLIPVLMAMIVVGCGGNGGARPFQVRDSAGIEIAESHEPLWTDGRGWKIGTDALLRIGVREGDEAYQFDGVTGAARLPDGTVVVADFGYQNVRYFDSLGRHLTTIGGPGEGPGEFQGLSAIGLGPGGRLWAYDFSLRRLSWLDQRGELVDLTVLGPEPAVLTPLGPLPDGTFLLKQLWGAAQVSQATEPGLRRDDVAFVRFDSRGDLVDTLGLFPGREVYLTEEDGRGVMNTPPFPRNSLGVIWGAGAVVGSNEAFDLVELTPAGEAMRSFRLPDLDLTLEPGDREDYISNRLATVPQERRPGLRNELESMPFPDSRPAFGGLLGDEDGNLWVADWVLMPQVAESWTVLDSSGRWLGSVEAPPRFAPMHIGSDWVLGVEWDEMDLEFVALYPLLKDGGNG